jgi:hypothetical protein
MEHTACSQRTQQAEFYAFKMIIEHHLGTTPGGGVERNDMAALLRDVNATPQEQLRQLKQAAGGFQLAHKVMTSDLYMNAQFCTALRRPLGLNTRGAWST